jgi:hypothetical protein
MFNFSSLPNSACMVQKAVPLTPRKKKGFVPVRASVKRRTRGGKYLYDLAEVSESEDESGPESATPLAKKSKPNSIPEPGPLNDEIMDCLPPPIIEPRKKKSGAVRKCLLHWLFHGHDYSVQSQNDFMAQYKENRTTFIADILSTEAGSVGQCQKCNSNPGLVRCRTCQFPQRLCKTCYISCHQSDPWHHPEIYSGHYFKRASLLELGFVLYLGHQGVQCPYAEHTSVREADEEGWDDSEVEDAGLLGSFASAKQAPACTSGVLMTLVDSSGVFRLPVQECKCPNSPPRWRQLLQARLFPASIKRPMTAFSFQLLDLLGILHVECKISIMSCSKVLQRLTNEAFPHLVPVSPVLMHWTVVLRLTSLEPVP